MIRGWPSPIGRISTTMNRDRNRRRLPYSLLCIALAALLMSFFALAFDAWAAPANSPFRQSVPTKTPLPGDAPARPGVVPGRPSPTPIPTLTPEPVIVPEDPNRPPLLLVAGLAGVAVAAGAASYVITNRRRGAGPQGQ